MQSFTAADIKNVGIGWRNCDRADRCRWLVIKNRLPRPAVINRFKNAAVHRRHVENVRLRRHSADGACPTAAIRSNIPPTQNRIEISRARLANSPNGNEPDCDCVSNPLHKPAFSLAMNIPATTLTVVSIQIEAEPHQIGKGTVWIGRLRFARAGRYDASHWQSVC